MSINILHSNLLFNTISSNYLFMAIHLHLTSFFLITNIPVCRQWASDTPLEVNVLSLQGGQGEPGAAQNTAPTTDTGAISKLPLLGTSHCSYAQSHLFAQVRDLNREFQTFDFRQVCGAYKTLEMQGNGAQNPISRTVILPRPTKFTAWQESERTVQFI